jgi:hypothetical protein
MKRFLASLIVVALTSNCAAPMVARKPPKVPATMPSTEDDDTDEYFALIDPDSPPTDGVWMSWEKARRYVQDKRADELRQKTRELDLQEQRDLEKVRREGAERREKEAIKIADSWWSRWGAYVTGLVGLTLGITGAALVVRGLER